VASGFALVIVLWVLAGLTVVAVAVASSARVSSESTRLLRDRIRAEAAFISTAARIQLIASTSVQTADRYQGLRGSLYLDGRTTQVGTDESVVLQDGRGLVNLNRADGITLSRLLVFCGVPVEATASLTEALADYVDTDTEKRLNGAEAFDYRMANATVPPPRNAPLLSREEVWRVLGWASHRSGWEQSGCSDYVTVHGDSRYNQNTATLGALRASGMDAGLAQSYHRGRSRGEPSSANSMAGPSTQGQFSLSMLGGGFVGNTMRVRHQMRRIEWALEYELELTPSRTGGPWRLHEVRYLTALPDARPDGLASRFPAVDYRPTEQEVNQANAPSRLPFN
jgi:general secretion pathway protein K